MPAKALTPRSWVALWAQDLLRAQGALLSASGEAQIHFVQRADARMQEGEVVEQRARHAGSHTWAGKPAFHGHGAGRGLNCAGLLRGARAP
jgi:hypothetical protein